MKKLVIFCLYIVIHLFCCADVCNKPVAENNSTWNHIPASLRQAKWIWPKPGPWGYDIFNSYAQFRQSFELKEIPQTAPMYITADQSYRLYINGEFVGSGPARGFQRSWPYDEYDVAKYLKRGKNLIAVRVYSIGRSTFYYVHEGRAGLLFALDLGKQGLQISNKETLCRRQKGCSQNTAPNSLQLENQEHIDLRIEDTNWFKPDFCEKNWSDGVNNADVFNVMPFYNLEAREIPNLAYKIIKMQTLIAEGAGKSLNNSFDVRNPRLLFEEEGMKHQTKIMKQQDFIEVKASKENEQRSYLIDFGKVNVGYPIVKVEGAKGGELVDIVYSERYNEKDFEFVFAGSQTSRPAPINRFVCRAGDFSHEFFALKGFRYAMVRVRNNSADFKITMSMRWAAYPLAEKGKFVVSNENAQRIWEASKHTQKICSLDAYVDTPWREQAQWWGDARVQAWNTFFLANDARLLKRGIRIIAGQQVPNGLTYGLAPTFGHACILPDFSLIWICTLWDYYWQTGSLEPFKNHKKVADDIISYFENRTDAKTGLVSFDSRYWLFLDWTGVQREGQPAILNHWYLYALDKLVELAKLSGMNSEAKRYERIATNVRKSITTLLIDKDGFAIDGILPDGSQSAHRTIQTQILSRMNKIKNHNFEGAKNEIILPYLRGELKLKATPSSYWVVYVLKTMMAEGYHKDVYNYILKNWEEMGKYGTTYEGFEGNKAKNTASRSHAWSAHPLFILPEILSGIKQEDVAWKKVSVKPNLLEDEFEVVYPTPQGDIKVWKTKSDKHAKIEAPKGIEIVK